MKSVTIRGFNGVGWQIPDGETGSSDDLVIEDADTAIKTGRGSRYEGRRSIFRRNRSSFDADGSEIDLTDPDIS